ncbi:hypothetical protein ON003_09140 [Janibacter hoylei]|uniref:hypothetical protein n=1 Tax=Janibacter hoylei TaxID=364298 RepID=UPI002237FEA4|nr:hypothetical protein [Janibacter hoylei]MCW4601739.1 hypothetical protein [Janibacter hoylei]
MTDPTVRPPLTERIAAAPISWGVCEVLGWGWQHQPQTVLTQMRELGIAATEFGPDGFLPDDPQAKADTLAQYGLAAVGQFVPVVLHDPSIDPLPTVETAMAGLVAARATTVVIAAATGAEGYDARPELDEGVGHPARQPRPDLGCRCGTGPHGHPAPARRDNGRVR